MNLLLFTYENLLSPAVLFFLLGLFSSKIKSNLRLPENITQALGYYLIFAVGFRSGVELVRHPLDWQAFATLLTAIFLSFNFPFLIYGLCRLFLRRLQPFDAAAIAAHFGSINFITFIAATSFLTNLNQDFESYLSVCVTLMESPAIVSALLIKHFWLSNNDPFSKPLSENLRQLMFPGSSVLLVGSFLVGAITGNDGAIYTYGFLVTPFQGILCFFLLDMGLVAGRQLNQFRKLPRSYMYFSIFLPILCGVIGILTAALLGLSPGGATLLAVLCGSASFIVAPAAIRIGIPEADHSLALTLALGIAFPFNMIISIPLFYWLSLVTV